jgi:type II secretory pathway pseudopilin PulG
MHEMPNMPEDSKKQKYMKVFDELLQSEQRYLDKMSTLQKRLEEIPNGLTNEASGQLKSIATELNTTVHTNNFLAVSEIDLKSLKSESDYISAIDNLNEYYQSESFERYVEATTDFALFYALQGLEVGANIDKSMPSEINAPSISSLLIEPIQRVMRHPLLGEVLSQQLFKSDETASERLTNGIMAAKQLCDVFNEQQRKITHTTELRKVLTKSKLSEQLNVSSTFRLGSSAKAKTRQLSINIIENGIGTLVNTQLSILSATNKTADVKKLKTDIQTTGASLTAAITKLTSSTKDNAKLKAIESVRSAIYTALSSLNEQASNKLSHEIDVPLDDGFSNNGAEPINLNPDANEVATRDEVRKMLESGSMKSLPEDIVRDYEINSEQTAILKSNLSDDEQEYIQSNFIK